jgi:hypothetical protein
LGDVVEVEDKGNDVSVPTTKIHEVEANLHSFLTSTVDNDVVVSFVLQPPYSGHPMHRRRCGHRRRLDRREKYFALDERKHKRKLKKVDVKFEQSRSGLVQGDRNNKRVA